MKNISEFLINKPIVNPDNIHIPIYSRYSSLTELTRIYAAFNDKNKLYNFLVKIYELNKNLTKKEYGLENYVNGFNFNDGKYIGIRIKTDERNGSQILTHQPFKISDTNVKLIGYLTNYTDFNEKYFKKLYDKFI